MKDSIDSDLLIHNLENTTQLLAELILDETNKSKLNEAMSALKISYNLEESNLKPIYAPFRKRMPKVSELCELIKNSNDHHEILQAIAEFFNDEEGEWLSTSSKTCLLKFLLKLLPNYKNQDEHFFSEGTAGTLFQVNYLFQKKVKEILLAHASQLALQKKITEEIKHIDLWKEKIKVVYEEYTFFSEVLSFLESEIFKNMSLSSKFYLNKYLSEEKLPRYKNLLDDLLSNPNIDHESLSRHKFILELKFIINDHKREEEKRLQKQKEEEITRNNRNKENSSVRALQEKLKQKVTGLGPKRQIAVQKLADNNEAKRAIKTLDNFFKSKLEAQKKKEEIKKTADEVEAQGYRTFKKEGIGKIKDKYSNSISAVSQLFKCREQTLLPKKGIFETTTVLSDYRVEFKKSKI